MRPGPSISEIMGGAETGSDSENDEAVLQMKKQRAESRASVRLESSLCLQARPRSSAKSPAHLSPSLRWPANSAGGAMAMEPPISLPADQVMDGGIEAIQHQNRHMLVEMGKLSDAVVQLQGIVTHLARELSVFHGQPQMFSDLPPVYNPMTDERPRPGPKDASPRPMEPAEMGVLKRKLYEVSMEIPTKRMNIRRIVDPVNWNEPRTVKLHVHAASPATQWKLWNYAFNASATLNTVLTPDEIAASEQKKPRGESGLANAVQPRPVSSASRRRDQGSRALAAAAGLNRVDAQERDINHREALRVQAVGDLNVPPAPVASVLGDASLVVAPVAVSPAPAAEDAFPEEDRGDF